MANKFTNMSPDVQKFLDGLSLDDITTLKIRKEQELKRSCHHNKLDGASLVPIANSDLPKNVKEKYGNTVVVCGGPNGCGEIIDLKAYSKQEIDNAIFMFRSMLNQIQITLAEKFDETDQTQMTDGFVSLEYLEKISHNVYGEMRKMLENEKKKQPKNGVKKGGVGINRNFYNN